MFGFWEAILSFLTRQVGLRTDAANAAGSLHAKVRANYAKMTNIETEVFAGVRYKCLAASNTQRYYNAGPFDRSGYTSPSFLCRAWVNGGGKIRVSFKLRNWTSISSRAYCAVYVNNMNIKQASLGNSGSDNTTTFTYDIPVPEGAYIDFYAWNNNSDGNAYVTDIQILFDIGTIFEIAGV